MCRIFAGQKPERYALVTRKLRLGGHSTSIRLEAAFWEILEEIAQFQGVSLSQFLTTLHDEVLEYAADRKNFTGLLRCACLTYLEEVRNAPSAMDRLEREAAKAFGGQRARQPDHQPVS